MKHHEYQLYYGGHKYLLAYHTYCEDCKLIISNYTQRQLHFDKYNRTKSVSHKKQTVKPRIGMGLDELPEKN